MYNEYLMEIIKRTQEAIRKYDMLSPGDHILIGLSGGPDSTCLAVVLDKLRYDFNLSLSALYVDHMLRPDEVKREIAFCRQFCLERSIEFFVQSVDVKKHADELGGNMQETARELRYQAYEDIAKKINASKIALGHNADDQAETVVMRLFRGAGKKGLSGIPAVRGGIIRPLIEIERQVIEQFLSEEIAQTYMIDSSNAKDNYFRNWLRGRLFNDLKEWNPSVIRDICKTADILREEDEYLELIVTKTLMRLISRKGVNRIELFIAPLESIEKPVLRRILRRAVEATEGLRGIGFVHIEDIIKLIKKGKPGDRIHLPKGVRVVKEYSILKISSDPTVKIGEYEIQPPCEINIGEIGITLEAFMEDKAEDPVDGKTSCVFDADAMIFPLKIRARAEGDFFCPAGFGKRKKLQNYFVDEKVPRDERDRIPIVLSGNDIIWVAGYRADDRFKVTDRTGKILKLKITEA